MKAYTEYLKFHTPTHRAYIHLTPQIEAIVSKSKVKEGLVLVSAMQITAAICGPKIWRRSIRITSTTRRERITASPI